MNLLASICLAWCLSDCGAITWGPVPDLDVDFYIVRILGFEIWRGPCCEYVLPLLTSPTEFNIVAVDVGGQESLTAARLLVDPDDPATFMQVDCSAGDCRQFVCAALP